MPFLTKIKTTEIPKRMGSVYEFWRRLKEGVTRNFGTVHEYSQRFSKKRVVIRFEEVLQKDLVVSRKCKGLSQKRLNVQGRYDKRSKNEWNT